MDQEYDVIVVGSGIGGMAAALAAGEHGLRTTVFARGKRGAHHNAKPTTMTSYSWSIANFPCRADFGAKVAS